ncbi:MAG: malto-oligosyltrehalose trehalohydrolase [Elusimicrobia bacterium]|nr:malto-oligosyltrehalose trehalohydrolase [Elusimicrobiota bacterium]
MIPKGRPWKATLGATVRPDGLALRVWAPRARAVDAVLDGTRRVRLGRGAFGLWEGLARGARAGTRYAFCLDGGPARPDPLSRFQPDGAHGASEAIDPSFAWTDRGWRGVPLSRAVLYEAHVGTFSPEGDYAGLGKRLDHLVDLGVTVLELLPVAQGPGRRTWGYDGTLLYAPHAPYGRPDDLKRLVDACHARGLAVCFDVVYNHLGPEGNTLDEFGPYTTDRYRTPWGPAMNYDGAGSDAVRRWAIENALYWVTEFHGDALRLDAVPSIVDTSPVHIIAEVKAAVAEQARRLGRWVWVVAESDAHDARMLRPESSGGWGLDAVWADDFHHGVHVRLTGDQGGYYADYTGLADAKKSLEEGWALDGRWSPFRGRRHGTPTAGLPPERFVFCIQNHDQVGNRAKGDRIASFAGLERQKACAALLLLAPQTPLLFMGEEWGELGPFFFFTDYENPALGRACRRGRRAWMREFGWSEEPPDPQAESTFARSRLDWSRLGRAEHAGVLSLYRELLRLRRSLGRAPAASVAGGKSWLGFRRGRVAVVANLGNAPIRNPYRGRPLLSTREPRFGGPGEALGRRLQAVPPRSASVLESWLLS